MAISKIGTTSKIYKNMFVDGKIEEIIIDEDGNYVDASTGGDSSKEMILPAQPIL